MSRDKIVTGYLKEGRKKVEYRLALICFEDEKKYIVYCPALDLSGYGLTETEAEKSFNTTLSEYFKYTLNKGTLAEDLKKLGWTIKKGLNKKPIPPTMETLLSRNEDFNRIFNTYDFSKRSAVVEMPLIP